MSTDSPAPLTLRVLGSVEAGLWAQASSGGTWLLHATPADDRLGPLVTPAGTFFASPRPPRVTLWELVVAHPDGIGAGAAVTLLTRLVVGCPGRLAFDPDRVWLDAQGQVVQADPAPDSLALGALASALTQGEVAATTDAPWVRSLTAIATGPEALVLLAAEPGDPQALVAAIAALGEPSVRPHALSGAVLAVVGATPAPSVSPKVVTARIAALTMLLGVAAGWVLGRPAAGGPTVEGAPEVRVHCDDAPPGTMAGGSRCAVQVWDGGSWRAPRVDMGAGGLYDCRVERGEIACDEG